MLGYGSATTKNKETMINSITKISGESKIIHTIIQWGNLDILREEFCQKCC